MQCLTPRILIQATTQENLEQKYQEVKNASAAVSV
jgi:hypothetical protein